MKIAVISINALGDVIADKIKETFKADVYSKSNIENFNLKILTEKLFNQYDALIFISSTGIAVRAIAPYLDSKVKDPAVVVVDSLSKYAISLLSGHLGGANELTSNIAKILGAEAIITTATDIIGVEAPDIIAKANGLIIEDLKAAKEIAALLVDRKPVAFIDDKGLITVPKGYTDDLKCAEGIVFITSRANSSKTMKKENYQDIALNRIDIINKTSLNSEVKTLKLIRKNIILGVGCKKDFSPEEMKDAVLNQLEQQNIDKRAVKAICTVELKAKEKAILNLAEELDAEFKVYNLEEIKKVQHLFKGSDFVEKSIGVRSVCEPCVHLFGGKLISNKLNLNGMTLCIGEEC